MPSWTTTAARCRSAYRVLHDLQLAVSAFWAVVHQLSGGKARVCCWNGRM